VHVLWYFEAQIQRTRAAGVVPPRFNLANAGEDVRINPEWRAHNWVAEGPASYRVEIDRGQRYYHGFGEDCDPVDRASGTDWTLPESMHDLFVDPHTWEQIECWLFFYRDAVRQAKQGMQFKYNRLPGGREGMDVPLSAMKLQYQLCVWRNVDGVPEPVETALPDAWTKIKLFDLYRDSQLYGVPDQQGTCVM
jgi:hypothetical protein